MIPLKTNFSSTIKFEISCLYSNHIVEAKLLIKLLLKIYSFDGSISFPMTDKSTYL